MAAGKLHASTFTYPLPSQEAKILHESRNTPHSSKVSLSAGSARHAAASSPDAPLSPNCAAAGVSDVEEAGQPDQKTVRRVGCGLERAVLPRLLPRQKRWVGRGRGCRCTVLVVRRCVLLFLPLEQMEMLVRT